MQIKILPSFWILSLLITYMNAHSFLDAVLWMVIILVSVLVHELGHALISLFWKQRVRIELGSFGGATIREGDNILSPLKEFLVIVMGPFFGFMLAALSAIIASFFPQMPLVQRGLNLTIVVNICWSILNLLPVFPLDGGRLMAIVLENIFGRKGLRFSYIIGAVFALLFAIACMGVAQVFLGALFLLFAFESFRGFQDTRFLVTDEGDQYIVDEMKMAETEWQEKYPEKAISRLEALSSAKERNAHFIQAKELLAHFLLLTEQPKKAVLQLTPFEKSLSQEGLQLLQLALYRSGEYAQALRVGEKAFLETSQANVALINAFSAAHLQNNDAVINWLLSVKRSKTMDMAKVVQSEEFDSIRQDPRFIELAT